MTRSRTRALFGALRRRGLALGGSAVAQILVGSLLGQGLILAASPALTRLYTAEDFAALAIVTSISAVIGSISAWSWDRAIVIPAEHRTAVAIVRLGLIAVAATTVVGGTIALVARDFLARVFNSMIFVDYWWVVPATVFAIGVYSIISSWLVRMRNYGRLAFRNATLGASQALYSIAFGLLGATPFGLISSVGAGRVFASLGMLRLRRRHFRRLQPGHTLRETASAYRKFPLINSWSRLLNSLGLQLPVILIVSLYGSVEAGLYALTLRVLAAPVGVLSDAVSQYFEGNFAKRFRDSDGGLRALTMRVTTRLFLISALPAATILAFGPTLFGWMFGSDWRQAGVYAQILVISYLAQVCVSPISRALVIVGRHGTQLLWDSTRVIASSSVVVIVALFGLAFTFCALALAAVQVTWYLLLLLTSLRAARAADARTSLAVPVDQKEAERS